MCPSSCCNITLYAIHPLPHYYLSPCCILYPFHGGGINNASLSHCYILYPPYGVGINNGCFFLSTLVSNPVLYSILYPPYGSGIDNGHFSYLHYYLTLKSIFYPLMEVVLTMAVLLSTLLSHLSLFSTLSWRRY